MIPLGISSFPRPFYGFIIISTPVICHDRYATHYAYINVGRLKEREQNIETVQGLSGEFSKATRELADWLGDFCDRTDGLPKVSSQSAKQEAQRRELQVMVSLMGEQIIG